MADLNDFTQSIAQLALELPKLVAAGKLDEAWENISSIESDLKHVVDLMPEDSFR